MLLLRKLADPVLHPVAINEVPGLCVHPDVAGNPATGSVHM